MSPWDVICWCIAICVTLFTFACVGYTMLWLVILVIALFSKNESHQVGNASEEKR